MKVEEKEDVVIIDGYEIGGHIEGTCPICQFSLVYYEDFDASFCPNCNEWTESNCGDPDCDYCRNRPEKPLPYK